VLLLQFGTLLSVNQKVQKMKRHQKERLQNNEKRNIHGQGGIRIKKAVRT